MERNQQGGATIKASEFKAKCLRIMDEVAERGEEVVITKNGKPVSKLVPFRAGQENKGPFFGRGKGRIKILGDIVSPVMDEGNAEKGFVVNRQDG